jgi:hypothetical protein
MSLLDRRKKQRRKNAEPARPGTNCVMPVASIEGKGAKRKLVFSVPLFTQMRALRNSILNRFRGRQ